MNLPLNKNMYRLVQKTSSHTPSRFGMPFPIPPTYIITNPITKNLDVHQDFLVFKFSIVVSLESSVEVVLKWCLSPSVDKSPYLSASSGQLRRQKRKAR
jgi:hypothetical protein